MERKKSRRFSSVRCSTRGNLTYDPMEITNISNKHFSSVGHRLASDLPPSNRHSSEYLRGKVMRSRSFFIQLHQLRLRGRYSLSFSIRRMVCIPARMACFALPVILSNPLAKPRNLSVISGEYSSKLKHAKVIPVFKDDDETDPANYGPISLLRNYNRILRK